MRCLLARYKKTTHNGLALVAVKRDVSARKYFEFLIKGDPDSYIIVTKGKTSQIKAYRYSSVSGPAI